MDGTSSLAALLTLTFLKLPPSDELTSFTTAVTQ